MTARWLAFVIWGCVAASAVFWGLRLFVQSPKAPAHALALEMGGPARADWTRIFGAEAPPEEVDAPPPPGLASRFQLIGVAAPRIPQQRVGIALLAVDGKPPRAYRVGGVIDGELVLQSVHARGAAIGARGGPAQVQLTLAPLPSAATGSLPGTRGPAPMPQTEEEGELVMPSEDPPSPAAAERETR